MFKFNLKTFVECAVVGAGFIVGMAIYNLCF
jgi:hypothetical protein